MTPAARVVPDVASFSVDNGFWYAIPDHLVSDLEVGTIVRVPLSGRRVRGWVVELAEDRPGSLKDIAGISGSAPVFDDDLFGGLEWAARHYVAPVSALLTRATPPNLPRKAPGPPRITAGPTVDSPLSQVVDRSAHGKTGPVVALVGNWRGVEWLAALGPLLTAGKSALVIAASVAEVDRLADAVPRQMASAVVKVAGETDADDTEAWEAAQVAPRLVIGTPKTAAWRITELALVVVLEEGRRAMKDRQTPTIHVREMLRTRSRLERFNLVFFGPTPSVELLAAGAEVTPTSNRAWPLVEVVDRSGDLPGSGYLSDRVSAALSATVEAGKRAFVFTHRRVGAASLRCSNCRSLRTCSSCGARLGRTESCLRCGHAAGPCLECGAVSFEEMGTVPERLVAEIERRVGRGTATVHPGAAPITVGTERDLAALDLVSLAVLADLDGMLMGVGYRTSEEALRQAARLALAVRPESGARMMVQTSRPEALLVTALRRGDPIPYLERVLVERAREGMPPATEMVAVEIRGGLPDGAVEDLGGLEGDVLGPIEVDDGHRWLLVGDLGKTRTDLRKLVGRWRDKGATVRVDVDPIDV